MKTSKTTTNENSKMKNKKTVIKISGIDEIPVNTNSKSIINQNNEEVFSSEDILKYGEKFDDELLTKLVDLNVKPITRENIRKIMDMYFEHSSINQLLAHQIESFDEFIDNKLPDVIQKANPIIVRSEDELTKVTMSFGKHSIRKPTIHESNGSSKIMFPNDARQRNFTYASAMFVDIHIKVEHHDQTTGFMNEYENVIEQISIGKIPIMVNSKYCVLRDFPETPRRQLSECAYDHGGYFIVNGGERTVISQERIVENKPYNFITEKYPTHRYVSEVMSIPTGDVGNPRKNTIKIMGKRITDNHPIKINPSAQ